MILFTEILDQMTTRNIDFSKRQAENRSLSLLAREEYQEGSYGEAKNDKASTVKTIF